MRQSTSVDDKGSSVENQQLRDQLKMLEDEKNALLDYIEESVNITADASMHRGRNSEKTAAD